MQNDPVNLSSNSIVDRSVISISEMLKEAEEITVLLEDSKEDLKQKEALIVKVEEIVKETEKVLKSKIKKKII